MFFRILIVLAVGYAGLCLMFFLAQRRLLYFPQRQESGAALQEAKALGLEPWQDESGRILGWLARHPSARPVGTLLVFHGNAGCAMDRTYIRDAYQAPGVPFAMDLLLLEYPGYGPREGTPTEGTILGAGVEAIERLQRASSRPIFLLGESLGSAAAALTASRRPGAVKGLLLVTPLKDIPAIARRHYPILPSFLVRDPFRASAALAGLKVPISFLIAGRDEVVFPDLGKQLYEAYEGPKRLWIEDEATHNSLDFSPRLERWGEMLRFIVDRE